jgi:hypothetical protein
MSAGIVASSLPSGRNLLAISVDKTSAALDEYRECLYSMSKSFPWDDVIDLSGLPIVALTRETRPPSRLRRLRSTLESMRLLRRQLATGLGLDPGSPHLRVEVDAAVNELYLTCFHHPDVRALAGLLPSSRKAYYPHGLGCLAAVEAEQYEPYCRGPAPQGRWPRWADLAKRALLGPDAVIPRGIHVDVAYSFHLPAPWAKSQAGLRSALGRPLMNQVFACLPEEVQTYCRSLAEWCNEGAVLLTLTSADIWATFRPDLEAQCLRELLSAVVAEERLSRILLKPHPLSSEGRVARLADELRRGLPEVETLVVSQFRHYPVEVMVAPFARLVHVSLGSSATWSLKAIYGFRPYCSEELILKLFSNDAPSLHLMKMWLDGMRGEFVDVKGGVARC